MRSLFCIICAAASLLQVGAGSTLFFQVVNDQASTFYVSRTGKDSNAGSAEAPFATLAKCVSVVPSGGRCILSEGGRFEVQETVQLPRDVTIEGDDKNDSPAILDGSSELVTSWTRTSSSSCVYTSETLGSPVAQLWVNGLAAPPTPSPAFSLDGFAPLTPARFPNAKLSSDEAFNGAPSSYSGRKDGAFLYSSKQSKAGEILDDGTHVPSLESSGLDLTGAIAVLPLGTMGALTQGVVVKHHSAGSNSFTYDPPPGTAGKGHLNIPYYFEGSCALLDSEGEWCYDEKAKSLRVWLDGCIDPATVHFRAKRLDYLLSAATGAHKNPSRIALTLSNLVLWGGTFAAVESKVSLQNVLMLHPNANKYTLGISGAAAAAAETSLNNNKALGSFSAVNSTFEWFQSTIPFDRLGQNPFVSDCTFLRNGYALGPSASLGDGGQSSGLIFQHNTIRLFNSFTGLTPGLVSTIAYNEIAQGSSEVDGAGVHIHIKPQNGVLLYRNWAHDLVVKAFRFDRVNSRSATWGVNGTVVENVVWACASACFKGDHHTIARNTVFDSSDEQLTAALFVMMFDPTKSWSIPGENVHTKLISNAADTIFNVSGALPGVHKGNLGNTCVRDMLKSSGRPYDFRPKDGSTLARVGAGAFATPDSPLWVPGVRTGEAGSGHSNISCTSFENCREYYGVIRDKIESEFGANGARPSASHWVVELTGFVLGATAMCVGLCICLDQSKRESSDYTAV